MSENNYRKKNFGSYDNYKKKYFGSYDNNRKKTENKKADPDKIAREFGKLHYDIEKKKNVIYKQEKMPKYSGTIDRTLEYTENIEEEKRNKMNINIEVRKKHLQEEIQSFLDVKDIERQQNKSRILFLDE